MKDQEDYDEKAWIQKTPPKVKQLMDEGGKVGQNTFPIWVPSLGVIKYGQS